MSRSFSKRANPFKHQNVLLNLERLEDRTTPSCSALSGFVYHDVNNNGHFDTGETPIANSTIELRDSANKLIDTTTTNAEGYYEFSTDPTLPGRDATQTKTVTFPMTGTDFHLDGALEQFDPALGELQSVEITHAGAITSEIKFENISLSPSAITGTISGTITLTAPGVDDTLDISTEVGPVQAQGFDQTTDFGGASGGSFGERTASGTKTITLTGSDIDAYIGTGTVAIGEAVVATSVGRGSGNIDTQIRSKATCTVTVVYHYKVAECLAPGDYKIIQTEQPDGFTDGEEERDGDVIPNSIGTDIINVTLDDQDLVNNNFGELKIARISGHVYHDANNDGVFDASEDPIAGAKVTLTGPGGPRETTTNAAGFYEFTDLLAGTYQLNETQPASFIDGIDTAGTTGGVVTNDQIATITLQDNTDSQDNDFGELKPASIAGHVFFDANNNGVREASEAPIAGATVTLTGFDDQGPVSTDMTTNSLGEYKFSDLRPGAYAITETQPATYDDGKDKVGSQGGVLGNDVISDISLAAGVEGVNNDFGEIRPDRPGEPIPKAIGPFGGLLPIVSKVQLTAIPEPSALDPVYRGQMAFVVGTTITLTGQQPSSAQVLAVVKQLQNGLPPAAVVAQLWASDAHRALQADALYRKVLDRAPTSQERADTIQSLKAGEDTLTVLEELFVSAEYQQLHPTTDSLVEGLYEDIFNKIPGTQSTQDLLQFMDNEPLNDVVHGLLLSNESLANLIDDVYRQTVRRPATSAEIATWTPAIKAGTTTLDDLSQRLLGAEEFYQLAFVSVR